MCFRIALVLLLFCGIGKCQGRLNAVSHGRSAFVHYSTVKQTTNGKPLNVLSEAPVSRAAAIRLRPALFMSSEMRDDGEKSLNRLTQNDSNNDIAPTSTGRGTDESDEKNMGLSQFLSFLPFNGDEYKKPPPFQVEDANVLFFDVFLLLNLSLSISFWAVHRMSFDYIGSAVSEGSLLCLLWIAAGLFNGAFLYSAVDGHYGSTDERGGPKAAGLLGLHTFISASSLRIIVALAMAVLEHRKVGIGGEQLIPLEIAFGLVLMSSWRTLHSSYTPRL